MARILLVEDEIILAMATQEMVENLGHEMVGIANNSNQALLLIESMNPSLILMDIVIQGEVDGIELTAIVNQKYNIPVIYGTSHTDKSTLQRANQTSHRGILPKPLQMDELSSLIEQVIQSSKSDAQDSGEKTPRK